MKALMLAGLMTGVLLAQSADPSRPFPNHEQPPEGWFCHPALDAKDLQTSAHACACRGMTMTDPEATDEQCATTPTYDDDGNPNGEVLIERSTCKVYCHASHCHCRKRCGTT